MGDAETGDFPVGFPEALAVVALPVVFCGICFDAGIGLFATPRLAAVLPVAFAGALATDELPAAAFLATGFFAAACFDAVLFEAACFAVACFAVACFEVACFEGAFFEVAFFEVGLVKAGCLVVADFVAADFPVGVFAGADVRDAPLPVVPRAALVFVAGLLPVAALAPLVLTALVVAVLRAAGLLAPVFLLADLRGLVVAMRVSRRMDRAVVGGPPSIALAACTRGDRGAKDYPPNDGCISPCRNAGPTRGSSSSVNSTP